jgi:hypothetical protein
MDKIEIYIYYDYKIKKYISYVYLLSNKCMMIEENDIFLCLSETYKYLNIICYQERFTINKDTTYINILEKGYKYNEMMSFKYRDIYNIIF